VRVNNKYPIQRNDGLELDIQRIEGRINRSILVILLLVTFTGRRIDKLLVVFAGALE
jgi:hypothetical protein